MPLPWSREVPQIYTESVIGSLMSEPVGESEQASSLITKAIYDLTDTLQIAKMVPVIRKAAGEKTLREVYADEFNGRFWSVYNYTIREDQARAAITPEAYDFVMNKLTQLSAYDVWNGLLRQSPKKVRREFIEAASVRATNPRIDEIAQGIALQNTKFFTITNQMIGLAILFGRNFENYIVESQKPNLSALPAVRAIGEMFGDPVDGLEDMFGRWQKLFPAETPANIENTAMGMLLKHHAFQALHDDYTGYCKAVKLTGMLYQAHGIVLQGIIEKNYPEYARSA